MAQSPWTTKQNNPLPEWNPEWGGYGPNPFAGYDRMAGTPPGSIDVIGMNPYSDPADIASAQAHNAKLQQAPEPAVTPKPSSGSSSKPKTTTSNVSTVKSSPMQVSKRSFDLGRTQNPQDAEFRNLLMTLANAGGRPNTDALNLRLESAREQMDKTRRSQSDSLLAQLSDLGLYGDGATYGGLGRLEENLASEYTDSLNNIYADEYNRADDRMMGALAQLSGLQTADLDREVDWFGAQSADEIGRIRAAIDKMQAENANALGWGQLGLGQNVAANNYSLGLGNLQLGQDQNLIDAVNQILDQWRISGQGAR